MEKSLCKKCGELSYLDSESLCFRCRTPVDDLEDLKKRVIEMSHSLLSEIDNLSNRVEKLEAMGNLWFK